MVTSRDVAREAGVSQATVSRVLAGAARVTPATAERVRAAMARVGYVPNAAARTMKTRRTGAVGVVVADITNPFYPQVLDALSAELGRAGQRMTLWNAAAPEAGGEESAVEAIQQGQVDGLIFTTVTADSTALMTALDGALPVVLLNRGVPNLACDQVVSDNVTGAGLVADYLVDAGHERIGFIGGPDRPSTAVERAAGFRAGLMRRGVELPTAYVRHGDFSHASGHSALRDLRALDPPPTAVFCANDLTAFGALDAARSLGVRVPDDLWVVGFDDVAMAAWEAYDLTTVRQPLADMVARAVELLLARIADPARPPRREVFPAELVIRGSSGPLAAPGRAPERPESATRTRG